MPDPVMIAAGHKANLKNPKTSEESKEHSKEILDHASNGANLEKTEGKDPANVVAGHKANLNNPITSEESKQYSKGIVEMTDGKDPNHVAGGLKAALANPNVPEGTKDDVTERLNELGQ